MCFTQLSLEKQIGNQSHWIRLAVVTGDNRNDQRLYCPVCCPLVSHRVSLKRFLKPHQCRTPAHCSAHAPPGVIDRWELLQAQALSKELRMKQNLQKWQQFKSDLDNIWAWLGETEEELDRLQHLALSTDIHTIESHIKKLKVPVFAFLSSVWRPWSRVTANRFVWVRVRERVHVCRHVYVGTEVYICAHVYRDQRTISLLYSSF